MQIFASQIVQIYQESIGDWHKNNAPASNPYSKESLSSLLYQKAQVDTIQWHEEDEIRRPDLPDQDLVRIKRNIDRLNQERTDLVEKLDDMFLDLVEKSERQAQARMNSETPAWLMDRMSILELKIWHMREQTTRTDVDSAHIALCQQKLDTLLIQEKDMSQCFDELVLDIQQGTRYFKVYRQMKMYNSQELNPALYKKNGNKS